MYYTTVARKATAFRHHRFAFVSSNHLQQGLPVVSFTSVHRNQRIMSVKATYQQIREQLINLSVDLEDKSKVCKILEQKTRDERHLLGLVEAEYENKYQSIIEVS